MGRFNRENHTWTFRCDRCGSRATGPADNLIDGKDLCDDCATAVREAAEPQPSFAVDLLSNAISTAISTAVDYGLTTRRMSKCPRCRRKLDGFSCPYCRVDFVWQQEGDAWRDGKLVERPETRSDPQSQPLETWAPGWYQTEDGRLWWDGARWMPSGPAPAQHWPDQGAGGWAVPGLTTRAHARHLMLTLFTCGLWAPVWIWRARKRKASRHSN